MHTPKTLASMRTVVLRVESANRTRGTLSEALNAQLRSEALAFV